MRTERVFYAYTPHPTVEMREVGWGERATVAARLIEEEDGTKKFEYGVAICNAEDNFNKQIGRVLALNRLNKGFGSTVYNEYYKDLAEYFAEDSGYANDGTERVTIQFVNDLANSVFKKIEKYKRKLANLEK